MTPPNPLPSDPCQALAQAKQQMYAMISGGAVRAIETPQLGRVEYSQGSVADLQRTIDWLTGECAAASGDTTTAATQRRRPLSLEAWP